MWFGYWPPLFKLRLLWLVSRSIISVTLVWCQFDIVVVISTFVEINFFGLCCNLFTSEPIAVIWGNIEPRTQHLFFLANASNKTPSAWTFSLANFSSPFASGWLYVSRCAVTLSTVQGSNLFGQWSIYAWCSARRGRLFARLIAPDHRVVIPGVCVHAGGPLFEHWVVCCCPVRLVRAGWDGHQSVWQPTIPTVTPLCRRPRSIMLPPPLHFYVNLKSKLQGEKKKNVRVWLCVLILLS